MKTPQHPIQKLTNEIAEIEGEIAMGTPDKNVFKITESATDFGLFKLMNRPSPNTTKFMSLGWFTVQDLENLRFVLDCFFKDVEK